jgi:CRISPR/Cas system endoribonuclease Cas6 (RAMP superfamily)
MLRVGRAIYMSSPLLITDQNANYQLAVKDAAHTLLNFHKTLKNLLAKYINSNQKEDHRRKALGVEIKNRFAFKKLWRVSKGQELIPTQAHTHNVAGSMKSINIGRDALNINDQNKLPLISSAAFCHWLRGDSSQGPFELFARQRRR